MSNTAIGSFSGNVFTATGTGDGKITASVSVNGSTLTASVPLGVYTQSIFSVAPSAIVWTTGAGTITLTPVYIGTGSVSSYSYSSSNSSVVSVASDGTVTFNGAGECTITVTANGLTGNPSVIVPVLVVGNPPITLPIARVAVTPSGNQIFKGDNVTLSAKAYDMNNSQVSSASYTWAVQDASIASVDATGKVTGLKIGTTIVTATASGIVGQAEIEVLPDTAIIVTPYWSSIGAGNTQQFTATAYAVNHATKALSTITMPVGLTWTIPTYGISLLDIATVNSTGLVTMKSSATPGLSTILMATINGSTTIEPGVAMLMVAIAGSCNCGSDVTGVDHIALTSASSVNLSMTGTITSQINAQAVDNLGAPVSGATIVYCSDNIAACNVDTNGLLTATGMGTANIKLCVGSKQTTVTVNVGF